jgi:proton-dependent oligopeptide transporter, POT family
MEKIAEAERGPACIDDGSHSLRDATEEEIASLRHVVDKLPRKVWVSLLVSGAERFTYYTISTPWRKSTTIRLWHTTKT